LASRHRDLRDFAKTMNLAALATYLMRSKRGVREKMEQLGFRVPAFSTLSKCWQSRNPLLPSVQ
jgi:hypothetical protein